MTTPRLRRVTLVRLALVAGILAGPGAVLMLPTAPRATAGEPGTPFVQVRVDQVTPAVVTTTSEPVVTVTGMVTNVGDRPVRDVKVRLERAAAVNSSAGLRTNLDGRTDQYQPVANFLKVAGELQRGQEAGFALSAPLRSLTRRSLSIDRPGVYPLLVNANGTPDYGHPARLDNARFLLPVVGVPADPADTATDALSSVVAPDTTNPVQITMLWPITDRPRLSPGVPGGTMPVRLIDDDLAVSLAAGGRLDILLSAAEFATGRAVDADGAVGRALCLAVDPDLLVTVRAMTSDYVVSNSPVDTGPGTPAHPGTGQAAAVSWLDRLRALAHRMCVTPTPYARADLDAIQRVGDGTLTATATNATRNIVNQVLGIDSARGATLIADGVLTHRTMGLLSASGSTVVIAPAACPPHDSANALAASADIAPRRASDQLVVAPFDPIVGAALAAAGTDPLMPTYLDASLTVQLGHDSHNARRQDALGSMLWRSLQPSVEPRTEILLPPTTWYLQPDDAAAILSTLATAIHSGLAVPLPLPELIANASNVPAITAPAPADTVGPGGFDDGIVTQISEEMRRLGELTSALKTDGRGLTGAAYTAPLREDMLRAVSQSERPDIRNELAKQRLAIVGTTIDDFFGAVTIVNPSGSYTLATGHSPLPLALHNGLPVPIRVRLRVDAPPGMTVSDVGEIELPPGYLPLRIPIEVNFTQRVAIDVSLHTPDGIALGEPVRLSVHPNAYGRVLFAITLAAAAMLVTLAGRRLWHRFRGQPDPADLDRPDPAPELNQALPAEKHLQVDDRVEEGHRV